MDSAIVGEIGAAEVVQCLGAAKCEKTTVDRLQVHTMDGRIHGWVSRKMVEPEEDEVQVISTSSPIRLWVLSDVHTDRPSNTTWLKHHLSASGDTQHFDVLLCAGDVSSKLERLRDTLSLLASRFELVVFTPGNHDGWVTIQDQGKTTIDKFNEVRLVCSSLGVRLGPVRVNSVMIVPLYSWYDAAFDEEPEIEAGDSAQLRLRWIDYTYCRWGPELERAEGFHFSPDRGTSPHVAEYFARLNVKRIENVERILAEADPPAVLTMSHFVPRLELLPERRFLVDPHLPKVSGSKVIEAQLRRLKSSVHVFGHTHLAMDMHLDGVRYVNWPLGSDRERPQQTRVVAGAGALLLYASDSGWAPTQWTFWSHWYRCFDRDPANTRLAPWVAKAYTALGFTQTHRFVKEDDITKLPSFPDNMPADTFYRINANKERRFRSSQDGEDLRAPIVARSW